MAERARYPSLAGRAVFISGGATGIGAHLVEAFAAQGARVGFVDLAQEAGAALAERLAATYGGSVWFETVDVTDTPAYQAAIRRMSEAQGPIRVLINNAAKDSRHDLEAVTPDLMASMLAVNFSHHVFAIQAVAPMMEAAGGGSIINMGSVSWIRAKVRFVGYGASKAAITGMTRLMANELGARAIRVNCLMPGAIPTERQILHWTAADEAKFLELQALKYRVLPDDIAAMALFLAADDARGCTGQNFIVDGGLV
jgi:NAD(P)-dependent dehydrogenase (short-subunit alcohol dehydrogenase family)